VNGSIPTALAIQIPLVVWCLPSTKQQRMKRNSADELDDFGTASRAVQYVCICVGGGRLPSFQGIHLPEVRPEEMVEQGAFPWPRNRAAVS